MTHFKDVYPLCTKSRLNETVWRMILILHKIGFLERVEFKPFMARIKIPNKSKLNSFGFPQMKISTTITILNVFLLNSSSCIS